MEEYIKNPVTKKWITVRGKVYADLLKTEYAPNTKRAKRYMRPSPGVKTSLLTPKDKKIRTPNVHYPKAKPTSLKRELKSVSSSKKALKEHGLDMLSNKQHSKTRGWSLVAPQRGKERQDLMNSCGAPCFLLPDKKGFPICQRITPKNKSCKVDCRGIHAAGIRAKEWGYSGVYAQTEKLKKQYGC